MNLFNLLDHLANDALAGHSIGERLRNETIPMIENDGVIPAGETEHQHDLRRIIRLTNLGLLEIFSKFSLLQKELILCSQPGITRYSLRVGNNLTGGHPSTAYILDSDDDPFEGDLIKVTRVVDPCGVELPINNIEAPDSVFLLAPEVIQLPPSEESLLYSVTYQARHPILRYKGPSILEQEIYLPAYLESALTAFIAYRVFSSMASQEYLVKSQEAGSEFARLMGDAQSADLMSNSTTSSHTKLEDRGFV